MILVHFIATKIIKHCHSGSMLTLKNGTKIVKVMNFTVDFNVALILMLEILSGPVLRICRYQHFIISHVTILLCTWCRAQKRQIVLRYLDAKEIDYNKYMYHVLFCFPSQSYLPNSTSWGQGSLE